MSGKSDAAPRIDRRTARTRNALRDALLSLILERGYEAVTVQDIIDRADVGRSTFYAHYTGKDDLLRRGFKALRAELEEARRTAATVTRDEPLPFSRAMFDHAWEYKDIYRAMVGGRGGVVAINALTAILSDMVRGELSSSGDASDDDIPRELRVQFVVGTLLAVISWSFEHKPHLPPERMDAVFRKLALEGMGG